MQQNDFLKQLITPQMLVFIKKKKNQDRFKVEKAKDLHRIY